MPLSIAQHLRGLATRCGRLSRDSRDPAIAKELETISFELAETAENLENLFTIHPQPPSPKRQT